jgi:hypothetical protein
LGVCLSRQAVGIASIITIVWASFEAGNAEFGKHRLQHITGVLRGLTLTLLSILQCFLQEARMTTKYLHN